MNSIVINNIMVCIAAVIHTSLIRYVCVVDMCVYVRHACRVCVLKRDREARKTQAVCDDSEM